MLLTYSTPNEYRDIHDASIVGKMRYASANDMECKAVIRESEDPYLEKLFIIREELPHREFIFFVDCDSFISGSTEISEFIDDEHLIVAGNNGSTGDKSVDLNTGNMVLVNHPLTLEMLDKAIAYYHHPDNKLMNTHDQGAFFLLLSREPEYKHYLKLDPRLNKTMEEFESGDLIIHLYNKTFEEKMEFSRDVYNDEMEINFYS